jgi:BirA family biotin operon repressor/biotin-[acetyl-CoA-carboxylase] ligase
MEMKSDTDSVDLGGRRIIKKVNMHMNQLKDEVGEIATSLKTESGRDISRITLLKEILAGLEGWKKILLDGGKRILINEWLRLDSTIGNRIVVKGMTSFRKRYGKQGQDGIISGTAEGIDDAGRLLLRDSEGRLERISAGDVTIIKEQD